MARAACARAREAGIELAPLLRRSGLTVRDIDNEAAPLTVAAQIKCLNALADALGDRLLGFHVAQTLDMRLGGLVYYTAASSELLGEALQRIARYSAMVNEGVKLHAEIGETLRLRLSYAGVSRRSDRHQIEGWATSIVRYCREMTGRDLHLLDARLMHHRIPESIEIDGFFGRSIDFSADSDRIAFAAEAARLPIIHADPFLNKLLIGYSEKVLAQGKARAGPIQTDVENALAALLPHGRAQIGNVARRLSVSPRTLRRKLAAEGLTFAGILETLRFALAKRYLSERGLSISRIAWLLGYAEVSAFSHAFRRWSGHAPRAARGSRNTALPPRRDGHAARR